MSRKKYNNNNNKTAEIVAQIPVFVDKSGKRTMGIPDVRVTANVLPGQKIDTPVRPVQTTVPREEAIGYSWANWGAFDDTPNVFEDKMRRVATVSQTILQNVLGLFGDGIVYCDESERYTPAIDRTPVFDKEIEVFLRNNAVREQVLRVGFSFFTHAQYFPIFTLSLDRTKIARVEIEGTPFCRKSVQNPITLREDYLFVSKKFGGTWGPPRREDIVAVPMLNNFDDDFFDRLKAFRFARHIYLPTTAHYYYPAAPWNGLFLKDNWIDIAENVPRLVKAMQDNQIRLKYIIKISADYFRLRFSDDTTPENDWNGMDAKKKREIIDQTIDKIEKQLTSVQNAGTNISYVFDQDEMTGKERGHIIIEAVDDKLKSGDWVPDVAEANQQIVLGLGGSGSIYGLQPAGGKMGAGSGSDKMQERNIQISTNTTIQDLCLDWLNYISAFNSWGKYFYFRDLSLTTKDKSAGGFVEAAKNIVS